jgi:hypothetical protein
MILREHADWGLSVAIFLSLTRKLDVKVPKIKRS